MSDLEFSGFPSRAEVTPLPNIFFTRVLPLIQSLAEVKVVMQLFFLISKKKGYPRFVSLKELSNDPILNKGLARAGVDVSEAITEALKDATEHGVLLHMPISVKGEPDEAYFINNEAERDTIAKICEGKLKIPEVAIREKVEVPIQQTYDIYSLYEQNIGLLTPIIAEELQEAEHRYPAEWIQEAFRIALRSNVRNWKYINGILKRWEREGKQDGRYVGDTREDRDPDKYIRGKYGHMVRR